MHADINLSRSKIYGTRRLYLAQKRLELIQAELNRRGLEAYVPSKRDFSIPLGISRTDKDVYCRNLP